MLFSCSLRIHSPQGHSPRPRRPLTGGTCVPRSCAADCRQHLSCRGYISPAVRSQRETHQSSNTKTEATLWAVSASPQPPSLAPTIAGHPTPANGAAGARDEASPRGALPSRPGRAPGPGPRPSRQGGLPPGGRTAPREPLQEPKAAKGRSAAGRGAALPPSTPEAAAAPPAPRPEAQRPPPARPPSPTTRRPWGGRGGGRAQAGAATNSPPSPHCRRRRHREGTQTRRGPRVPRGAGRGPPRQLGPGTPRRQGQGAARSPEGTRGAPPAPRKPPRSCPEKFGTARRSSRWAEPPPQPPPPSRRLAARSRADPSAGLRGPASGDGPPRPGWPRRPLGDGTPARTERRRPLGKAGTAAPGARSGLGAFSASAAPGNKEDGETLTISPDIRGPQGFYRSALGRGSGALTAAKVRTDDSVEEEEDEQLHWDPL